MNLELDHVFILVEPEAKVADLLLTLGIEESFSRDHQGQGTTNRRFVFANSMLEFLWIRDKNEALNGPGKDLFLAARAENTNHSPFGIILRSEDNTPLKMPFTGWHYQPDYFKPPQSFFIGENSQHLIEPLCVYAPFIQASTPEANIINSSKEAFKYVSHIHISSPTKTLSSVLQIANNAGRLTISTGEEHLMKITFDGNAKENIKDFRPDIPLIIYW